MISPGVFFIFLKILIFGVVSGVKGQKMAQNDKKFCLLHISQESYIIWLSSMLHLCEMMISPGVFFHFFKTLIFQVVRRIKGQKVTQNDKKLYLSCLISQAPYILWSLFMVNLCNRIISPGFFIPHLFQIFIFGVNSGVKGQKMAQNDQKLCQSYSISQEAYIIMIMICGAHV